MWISSSRIILNDGLLSILNSFHLRKSSFVNTRAFIWPGGTYAYTFLWSENPSAQKSARITNRIPIICCCGVLGRKCHTGNNLYTRITYWALGYRFIQIQSVLTWNDYGRIFPMFSDNISRIAELLSYPETYMRREPFWNLNPILVSRQFRKIINLASIAEIHVEIRFFGLGYFQNWNYVVRNGASEMNRFAVDRLKIRKW